MKPKHQRLIFIVASMACLCAAVLLTMQAFRENVIYFYSPSELAAKPSMAAHKIRIGGLVKKGTIVKNGDQVQFVVTDQQHEIHVAYRGMLPNLFREGQGVIAEGMLDAKGQFAASSILAKHDENYMPKEVVDALKKSGHWEASYAR